MASGSVAWYGKWVCRSTELRKQVCVGCVCLLFEEPDRR